MANDEGPRLGNYRLVRLLGRGGFADVFLGEHIYLKTSAAIKVLRTHLSDEALAEFLNEAQTIARLSHPHIVSVLDFGIEKALPYLVMTYAPHGTAREQYPESSILTPALVASSIKQIAQALQYAHERKIVHRDVKPENILIGEERQLMLSDFGIAITTQSMVSDALGDGVAASAKSKVVGTTTYMAPEHFTAAPVYASDQYALGVVAYEWLAGRPPFIGGYMEVVRQHIYQNPPSLREKAPQQISALLEHVVMKTLAKDPVERFATVQDFAQALEKATSSAPTTLRRFTMTSTSQGPSLSATGHVQTPQEPFLPPTPSGRLRTIQRGNQAVSASSSDQQLFPAAVVAQPGLITTSQHPASSAIQPQALPSNPLYSSATVSVDKNDLMTPPPSGQGLLARHASQQLIQRSGPGIYQSQRLTAIAPGSLAGSSNLGPLLHNQQLSRRTLLLGGLGAVIGASIIGVIGVSAFDHLFQTQQQAPAPKPTAKTIVKAQPSPTVQPSPAATQTPTATPNPVLISTSRPALASTSEGLMDMFVRGNDNAIWQRSYDGAWHPWQSILPGVAYNPAVVSWGAGRFDLFVRGADNTLQHAWYDGVWHAWENLGGSLTSDPAVSSWGVNRLDVFARSTDNAVWHIGFDGSWHAWESLGGVVTTSPTATSWGPNRIDVFARGTDNGLYTNAFDGSWHGWNSLGNSITSEPAAASWGPNRLDIFTRGGDNTLYHLYYNGSWQPWESLGSALTTAPTVVAWNDSQLNVIARGAGDAFQEITFASTWQPWVTLPVV